MTLIDMSYLAFLAKKISRYIRVFLCFLCFCISFFSYGSTLTEEKLKNIARDASRQIAGVDLGDGVVGRNVLAIGRTLMYQYDVPQNWQKHENAKNLLISTLKQSELGDLYFEESITLNYTYFKKNLPATVIKIRPHELSPISFKLGDFITIKDHPKSKGINLQIRPPLNWSVVEGNGPNIVKKFTEKINQFMIITKDMPTFFSRSSYRTLYSDEFELKDYVNNSFPADKFEVINYRLTELGLHPAIEIVYTSEKEIARRQVIFYYITWNILYEDKMISLSGMALNKVLFKELEKLYSMVAATVSFPEQFN